MSAHKFWDSFNIGFLDGMFGYSPLLGSSMPFSGGCNSYNSVFTPLSSLLSPFQSDSMMYMTPNAFSTTSIFPLMNNNIPMPSFENCAIDMNNFFPTNNWQMPVFGDTFIYSSPPADNSRKTGSKTNSSGAKLTSTSINDKYFDKMLSYILTQEGGYSNVSGDKGGKTYKGVTQTTYDNYRKKKKLASRDVRQMSDAEMKDIYYGIYKACDADKIDNPRMALMIFDVAVNSGPARAKKMFKESGGSISKFEQLRKDFYAGIVRNNPGKKKFINGWNNRISNIHDFAMAELPEKSSMA